MGGVITKVYTKKDLKNVFSIPMSLAEKLDEWRVKCRKVEFCVDHGKAVRYMISIEGYDVGNGMDSAFKTQIDVAQKLIEISFVLTARDTIAAQMEINGCIDEDKANLVPFLKEVIREFPRRRGKIFNLFKQCTFAG